VSAATPPLLRRVVEPFAFGLLTYIPGVYRLIARTGGTNNARYCYSVWLRHLVTATERGALAGIPASVAEIGPGDSIGIGLAALLSGAEHYSAIDVDPFARPERNLSIFREVTALFAARADIPDETEFPLVGPRLTSYAFPSHLLTPDLLARTLSSARLEAISRAIVTAGRGEAAEDAPLRYVAPWTRLDILPSSSLDMIYSQAVLEHVDALDQLYAAMRVWLKPGGVMSHDIDFSNHHIGRYWNSHYTYSPRAWRLIRGKRSWLLNRQPHSVHLDALRRHGFELIADVPRRRGGGIRRAQLAPEFRAMSDDDLSIAASYVVAVKR
jgi:SAM-dependent methyltransferase